MGVGDGSRRHLAQGFSRAVEQLGVSSRPSGLGRTGKSYLRGVLRRPVPPRPTAPASIFPEPAALPALLADPYLQRLQELQFVSQEGAASWPLRAGDVERIAALPARGSLTSLRLRQSQVIVWSVGGGGISIAHFSNPALRFSHFSTLRRSALVSLTPLTYCSVQRRTCGCTPLYVICAA